MGRAKIIEANEIIDEFGEWLLVSSEITSIRDYKKYVRNTIKLTDLYLKDKPFSDIKPETFKYFKQNKADENNFSNPIYVVEYMIDKEKNNRRMKIKKKTYTSDLKSGFRMFIEFLADKGYVFGDKITDISFIDKFELRYTKSQAKDSFISRLKTQDRIYKEDKIIFPIRLISKLFNHNNVKVLGLNKKLNDILNRLVDDIYFIISNSGDKIKFSTTNGTIRKQKNKIWNIGGEIIYTEVFVKENLKKGKYIPMDGDDFSFLSIDHDNPLHKLISKNGSKFNNLKELTTIILEEHCDSIEKLTREKLKSKDFSDQIISRVLAEKNESFIKGLYKEVINIFNDTEYIIMDRRENSAKNDN